MSPSRKEPLVRRPRGLAALIPVGDSGGQSVERPVIGQHGSSTGMGTPTSPHRDSAPVDAAVRPVAGLELLSLDPAVISVNPRQPRQEFDPDALAELARSLVEVGMLQPVVVRRVSVDGTEPDGTAFELVAGERRLRAARLAGMDRIPAVVRGTTDDDLLREALLENLQRVQLNPLEEAAAYDQLLVDFGGTHDELAQRLGRSRSQVSNTLRLLRLPSPVQRRVAAGVLSAGHARALLGLTDPDQMEVVATRIVAEGLSVRSVEEVVALESMSGKSRRTRRASRSEELPVEYGELERRLSERFDTRVRIQARSGRGRVQIEFSGTEDLFRIAQLIGDQPQ